MGIIEKLRYTQNVYVYVRHHIQEHNFAARHVGQRKKVTAGTVTFLYTLWFSFTLQRVNKTDSDTTKSHNIAH